MSLHHSLMQIRAAANTSTSSSERVAPEEERPAAKKRALHAELEGEKEKEEGEEKGEEEGEEEGEEAGEPPLRALFSTTEPRSLVELAYQMLVGEMRDKVSWERKVLNPEIADKWRTEAIAGFRGAAEADVNARLAAARAKGAHAARQARLIGDQFFGLMSSSRVQEIRAELESEAAADRKCHCGTGSAVHCGGDSIIYCARFSRGAAGQVGGGAASSKASSSNWHVCSRRRAACAAHR